MEGLNFNCTIKSGDISRDQVLDLISSEMTPGKQQGTDMIAFCFLSHGTWTAEGQKLMFSG